MEYRTLEEFCEAHGFRFHSSGRLRFGHAPYWELNGVEYVPADNSLKIENPSVGRFTGRVESVEHFLELCTAMKVDSASLTGSTFISAVTKAFKLDRLDKISRRLASRVKERYGINEDAALEIVKNSKCFNEYFPVSLLRNELADELAPALFAEIEMSENIKQNIKHQKHMEKALFIYGYGGSPETSTFYGLLKERLAPKYDLSCISYTQQNCESAKRELAEYIVDNEISLVAGVSLGGFLTLALETTPEWARLSDVKRVVINPCMRPTLELPKLKLRPDHPGDVLPSAEMVATYAETESSLLNRNTGAGTVIGFFGEADDLLGADNREVFESLYSVGATVRGGHGGSEAGADDIAEDILANNKLQ